MDNLDSLSRTYLEATTQDSFDAVHPTFPQMDSKEFERKYGRLYRKGDVLYDLYEVKGLALGGMGAVYCVWHRQWGIYLAMKSPTRSIWENPSRHAYYLREAEIWANLGLHPNVVSSYYVRTLENIPRIFMEYVEGGSLKNWIEKSLLYQGKPERVLATILDIAIQAAWGLEYAHENEMVHQDVKPANILVGTDCSCKVTDFGLARTWTDAGKRESREVIALHQVPFAGLTRQYCSPEQLAHQSPTLKTDLWSWAASVLEMFLGYRPWERGEDAGECLNAYLHSQVSANGCPIPPTVATHLRRCLDDDPAKRPDSMSEVADILQEIYEAEFGKKYPRPHPRQIDLLADTLNNKGLSLLDIGQEEAAEHMFEEALKITRAHPNATFNLGLQLWRTGRITDIQMVQRMEESQEVHKDDWQVHYYLALVHVERGDGKSAQAALEKIPKDSQSKSDVARCIDLIQRESQNWGKCLHVLRGHEDNVEKVAMTPDGHLGLSEDRRGVRFLWDLAGGMRLGKLNPDSQNGGWTTDDSIYSVDQEETVWDAFRRPLGTLRYSFASADGRLKLMPSDGGIGIGQASYVILADDKAHRIPDGFERSFDNLGLESIYARVLRSYEGHYDRVSCCAISMDGHLGLSGSNDFTLRVWSLVPGPVAPFVLARPFTAVELSEQSQKFDALLAEAANALSAGNRPDAARKCDGAREIPGYYHSTRAMEIMHQAAYTARRTGLRSAWLVQSFEGHKGAVCSLSVAADGQHILSGDWEKTIRFWNIGTGECLREIDGHQGRVESVALTPDAQFGISASDSLRLWDLGTGQCVRDFSVGASSSVAISKDGQFAASTHAAIIRLWSLQTGECLQTFEGHTAAVNCVRISDRCLVSGSNDRTIRIWDLQTGKCLRKFVGNPRGIESLAITPDDRFIFSGGRGGRLWEITTGKCLAMMAGHSETVLSVTVTPDGLYGITASMDHTMRLWELLRGKCLRVFQVDQFPIQSIAVLPSGFQVLSGSYDRTIKLWELDWSYDFSVVKPDRESL